MEPAFTFPFKPYAIQEQFMKELYFTLENEKVGIFESPTGTGKSLSICCATLQWLQDYNNKNLKELEKEIALLRLETSNENATEDWLQEEYEKIKKNQQLTNLLVKLDKIKKTKENIEAMRIRVERSKLNNKTIDNYFNDKFKYRTLDDKENVLADNIDDADLLLDDMIGNCEDSDDEVVQEVEEKDDVTKIYISSRTHSQLSQFVGEIKKTIFKDTISVVTLASRAHYCINNDVVKLKNVHLINERCLDLQKTKSKSTSISAEGIAIKKAKTKCGGCPYYNQNNINKLKERLLVDIMDMEDIVKNGKALKACPYYASRMALDEAQVVLVSHAGIVSTGARAGTQINLNNNILIIDEAHGLTSALEQANSAPVTAKQLLSVKTYLKFYINKYITRLNSKNLLSLNQMVFVVGRLLNIVHSRNANEKELTTIFTLEDFVIKAEIDHLNLRPLVQFCRNTKLPPKLHGFFLRYNKTIMEEDQKKSAPNKSSFQTFLRNISKNNKEEEINVENVDVKVPIQNETSPGSGLYALLDFLQMLCDRSENGRILCNTISDNAHLKYILLNSAEHFTDVVKQCRSVILAGGTMEPISEFEQLLFGQNKDEINEKLTVLRCEHVVPADNVLGICLSKGPTNVKLNFTYENRMTDGLLEEVCRILRTVCKLVQGGVIVFVPSYNQEVALYDKLVQTGVLGNIQNYKYMFREPKSAGLVDQVLNDFSSSIRNKADGKNGAVLLSVVGGKLSEGLNFSDDLGRCVIVIGMPYPNIKSPELQQKMNYLCRVSGSAASAAYYEGLCMKAVNQCIGRAIRHANDYACVLLIDERYSRAQTVSALPSFVQKSLKTDCTFGVTVGAMAKFFAKHKTNL